MDNGQSNMVVPKRLHCNDLPLISCGYFRPYLDSKECRPSVLTPLNRFLVEQGSIYVGEATGSDLLTGGSMSRKPTRRSLNKRAPQKRRTLMERHLEGPSRRHLGESMHN